MGEPKIFWRMVSLSILAHLALVLLLPGIKSGPRPTEHRLKLTLLPAEERGMLVQPPESARVPETPADAANPAEFNARAQNPEPAPAPDANARPRSLGDIDLFDFRRSDLLAESEPRRKQGEEKRPTRQRDAGARDQGSVALDQPAGSEANANRDETRVREARAGDARSRDDRSSGRPRPRNRSSGGGVATGGEVSLSTYQWAWAPYLAYLKETITTHWHPPLAFYMGLVDGDGVIRFRVHLDGSVTGIEQMDERGHPSLSRAARNAIDYAGQLRPLPDGFPDPHLDVAWQYRYIVYDDPDSYPGEEY